MLRIDEIYVNTFGTFFNRFTPHTRLFYCDPPGTATPDHLSKISSSVPECNYVLFHDQEPVQLDIHKPLFNFVEECNRDITPQEDWRDNLTPIGPRVRGIVTSELNSESVEQVCEMYKWRPYYYFFHGWASLDWYRGYNKTFLMPDPINRTIKKSFISPNRIIGGKRQHRVDLMYHLLKRRVNNALISFPEMCPVENIHIRDLAGSARAAVFEAAELPWNFPNEIDHPMHSCWLSLFDESAESLAYVVTETVFNGRKHHLTEKTFKPICLAMPFILVSTVNSLKYLQSYGFKTFDTVWDESYDSEANDQLRLIKIADLLKRLDDMNPNELQLIYNKALPIIQHNYNHFYNGGFEKILWDELSNMLSSIADDFRL